MIISSSQVRHQNAKGRDSPSPPPPPMPEKTKIHLKNGGGGSFDRSNNGNSNGRQQKIRPVRAESMTKGAAGSRQRAAHTDSFERYPPKNELGGGGRAAVKSKAATGKSRLSNASSRYVLVSRL